MTHAAQWCSSKVHGQGSENPAYPSHLPVGLKAQGWADQPCWSPSVTSSGPQDNLEDVARVASLDHRRATSPRMRLRFIPWYTPPPPLNASRHHRGERAGWKDRAPHSWLHILGTCELKGFLGSSPSSSVPDHISPSTVTLRRPCRGVCPSVPAFWDPCVSPPVALVLPHRLASLEEGGQEAGGVPPIPAPYQLVSVLGSLGQSRAARIQTLAQTRPLSKTSDYKLARKNVTRGVPLNSMFPALWEVVGLTSGVWCHLAQSLSWKLRAVLLGRVPENGLVPLKYFGL